MVTFLIAPIRASRKELRTHLLLRHATERMQDHHSSVDGAEKQTALAKVIHLATHRDGARSGEHTPGGAEHKEKAG